ncbi:hypothetical protein [Actinomadura sp. KC216]|uniref:hypothetical protein n=1 Tax=Actinomadura sp. KC216 TaxID=2530370 RepID=UPI001404DE54|nr:hypothetical protein [Actinomadura sp. KC216]
MKELLIEVYWDGHSRTWSVHVRRTLDHDWEELVGSEDDLSDLLTEAHDIVN